MRTPSARARMHTHHQTVENAVVQQGKCLLTQICVVTDGCGLKRIHKDFCLRHSSSHSSSQISLSDTAREVSTSSFLRCTKAAVHRVSSRLDSNVIYHFESIDLLQFKPLKNSKRLNLHLGRLVVYGKEKKCPRMNPLKCSVYLTERCVNNLEKNYK